MKYISTYNFFSHKLFESIMSDISLDIKDMLLDITDVGQLVIDFNESDDSIYILISKDTETDRITIFTMDENILSVLERIYKYTKENGFNVNIFINETGIGDRLKVIFKNDAWFCVTGKRMFPVVKPIKLLNNKMIDSININISETYNNIPIEL